jgi:hypothetical protein
LNNPRLNNPRLNNLNLSEINKTKILDILETRINKVYYLDSENAKDNRLIIHIKSIKINYIISLTTIPSKFDNLYKTIDSIITQTILPTKIIINIPKIYSFRMNNSEIPIDKINKFINKYSQFNCFINFLNKDYGPGTKLLGLLDSNIITNINNLNTYIILVDDDITYKPYMIETFDKEIKTNNINIGSFWVYHWHFAIGQGVDGFLIKLNKLDKFLNYYNVIKDQDYINYHDDFYISYYFKLINENIKQVPLPNNCVIYDWHNRTDALCGLEGKYNRNNLNIKSWEILNELNNNGEFNFLELN